jgi:hypothetical protein
MGLKVTWNSRGGVKGFFYRKCDKKYEILFNTFLSQRTQRALRKTVFEFRCKDKEEKINERDCDLEIVWGKIKRYLPVIR